MKCIIRNSPTTTVRARRLAAKSITLAGCEKVPKYLLQWAAPLPLPRGAGGLFFGCPPTPIDESKFHFFVLGTKKRQFLGTRLGLLSVHIRDPRGEWPAHYSPPGEDRMPRSKDAVAVVMQKCAQQSAPPGGNSAPQKAGSSAAGGGGGDQLRRPPIKK